MRDNLRSFRLSVIIDVYKNVGINSNDLLRGGGICLSGGEN